MPNRFFGRGVSSGHRIPHPADRSRGSPSTWTPPFSLSSKCNGRVGLVLVAPMEARGGHAPLTQNSALTLVSDLFSQPFLDTRWSTDCIVSTSARDIRLFIVVWSRVPVVPAFSLGVPLLSIHLT